MADPKKERIPLRRSFSPIVLQHILPHYSKIFTIGMQTSVQYKLDYGRSLYIGEIGPRFEKKGDQEPSYLSGKSRTPIGKSRAATHVVAHSFYLVVRFTAPAVKKGKGLERA